MRWLPAFLIGVVAVLCLLPMTVSLGCKSYPTWPPYHLSYALDYLAMSRDGKLPATLGELLRNLKPDYGRMLEVPAGLHDRAGLENWLYWPENGPSVVRGEDRLVLLAKQPLHYYRWHIKPYYPAVIRSGTSNFTVVRLDARRLEKAGVFGLVDAKPVRVPRWSSADTFGAIGRWILRLGLLASAGAFLWFQILCPVREGFSQKEPLSCEWQKQHGSWMGTLLFGLVVLTYWNAPRLPRMLLVPAFLLGLPAALAFGWTAVSKGSPLNRLGGAVVVLTIIGVAGLLVFSSERSWWLLEWW